MIVAERVRERLAALKLSQSELARRIGVTQPVISKIVAGTAQGSSHLHRIARELQTSSAYLSGETDDCEPDALLPTLGEMADHFDIVMIPSLDANYGMGGGTVIVEDMDRDAIPFPRKWLQSVTSSPVDCLYFARGKGDSMVPTIMDGDIVLIDRSQRRIEDQDLIWAISFGDLSAIKRVRRGRDGWRIISDSPIVSEDVLSDGELYVNGRVVWVGRRL